MQIVLLVLALLVCPIAYIALVHRMKTQVIDEPPVMPMFFLFGTIGGWLLAIGLSPSGLTATCIVFLITVAPIALFIASAGLCATQHRTIYHRVSIWSGFIYPAVLGLMVVVGHFCK